MRRRRIARAQNMVYLQQQQQPGQYPPPHPGGWGIPTPGAPSYPPKHEYPAGYSGMGGVATPQEPPKSYNPGQPAVSIIHHSSL